MAQTRSDLPPWLHRLPVAEQQRFMALSLMLLRTDAALRAVPAVGSMDWLTAGHGGVRAVAEVMRANAVHVRERAGLLESLGRNYDNMASILESMTD